MNIEQNFIENEILKKKKKKKKKKGNWGTILPLLKNAQWARFDGDNFISFGPAM
jgi:hypothetical protein